MKEQVKPTKKILVITEKKYFVSHKSPAHVAGLFFFVYI
jgi:hypothetical protein